MITDATISFVSFYLNGAWERPEGRTSGSVNNPATGTLLAEVPYADDSDVDKAVQSAHAAFLKWRDVPVVDRVYPLAEVGAAHEYMETNANFGKIVLRHDE